MWHVDNGLEDITTRIWISPWLFLRSHFERKSFPSFDFFNTPYFAIKGVQYVIQVLTACFVFLGGRNLQDSSISKNVLIPFHLNYFLANTFLFIFCTFFSVKKLIICCFELLTISAGTILSAIIFAELSQTDKEMRQVSLIYLPAVMLFSSLISLCCAQDFEEENTQIAIANQTENSEGNGNVNLQNTSEGPLMVVINPSRPSSRLVYTEDHPLHGTGSISRASTIDLSTLNPINQEEATRTVPPNTPLTVNMPIYCGFDSGSRSYESHSRPVEVIIPVHGKSKVSSSASNQGKESNFSQTQTPPAEVSGERYVTLNIEELRCRLESLTHPREIGPTRERFSRTCNIPSRTRGRSRGENRYSSGVLPPGIAILVPPLASPEDTQMIEEECIGEGARSEESGTGERSIGDLPAGLSSDSSDYSVLRIPSRPETRQQIGPEAPNLEER